MQTRLYKQLTLFKENKMNETNNTPTIVFPIEKVGRKAAALIKRDYGMVKTIKDAETNLSYKLKQQDIVKADYLSFTNCPGARCVKRNIPGVAAVVSRRVAYLIYGTEAVRYIISLRGSTRKIIENADINKTGTIGAEFTLLAPKGNNRLGSKHSRHNTGRGTKRKATNPKTVRLVDGSVVPLSSALRSI